MRFSSNGKEIYPIGIQGKPSNVIISNIMKKILKTGHKSLVAQLCSLNIQTYISSAPLDLKVVIKNNSKVFGEMHKGLPPSRDHDHAFNLQP
jgi:hypothetical protein